MLLKIDPKTVVQFSLINEFVGGVDHRRYYVTTGDRLVLLVLRNGLDLPGITGQVVDANIGWDRAVAGYARDEDIGKRRTKITVYRVVQPPPRRIRKLATVIARAPRRTPCP